MNRTRVRSHLSPVWACLGLLAVSLPVAAQQPVASQPQLTLKVQAREVLLPVTVRITFRPSPKSIVMTGAGRSGLQ